MITEAMEAVPQNHYFDEPIRYESAYLYETVFGDSFENDEDSIASLIGGEFEVYRPPMNKQLIPKMKINKGVAYKHKWKIQVHTIGIDRVAYDMFDKHYHPKCFNPNGFKNYHYHLNGIRLYQDSIPVYHIQIFTKDSTRLKSNLYLDSASLAFVQIEVFGGLALQQKTPSLRISPFVSKGKPTYSIDSYQKIDGRWVLNYSYIEGSYNEFKIDTYNVKRFFVFKRILEHNASSFSAFETIGSRFSITEHKYTQKAKTVEDFYKAFPYFSTIREQISN
ncbi:MAG: hypothetical protein JJT94_06750 [Bernardetiaceae bacterium]|nr:hypothetical protein [Bernardetiaceae bacterium]